MWSVKIMLKAGSPETKGTIFRLARLPCSVAVLSQGGTF